MYRMVISSVMLTVAALGFIFFKSDGLRAASQSGDFSALAGIGSTSVASKYSDIDFSGGDPAYEQSFFQKYNPRKLWNERPKKAKLNTKTIKVAPSQTGEQNDVAAQLAARGINPETVTTIKLK